jgi:hypothetical protein
MATASDIEVLKLKNFIWSDEAISDWEEIWGLLWRMGVVWEWQNGDRYARRYGETFQLFAVYNDPERLDMALPLPQLHVVDSISNWLLGAHVDDVQATNVGNLLRKWSVKYVE